jgi:hypothetical protein
LVGANHQYYASLDTVLHLVLAEVSSGGEASPGQGSSSWHAVEGSEFVVLTGLAAVVEAVVIIISCLSLGSVFLVTLLVKLLVGSAAGALPQLIAGLLNIHGLTSGLVSGSLGVVNKTGSALALSVTAWQTFLQLVEYTMGLTAIGLEMLAIASAITYGTPGVPGVFSVVLSVLSIAAWLYAHLNNPADYEALLVCSVITGLMAIVLGIVGAAKTKLWPDAWSCLVAAGVASVSVGLDIGEAVVG